MNEKELSGKIIEGMSQGFGCNDLLEVRGVD